MALRKSLTRTESEAYIALKEAILSFDLLPGAMLLEDELVKKLSISKTPVRSALMQLERDGLVVRLPYKGTYVSAITENDIREILQLKAMLEGFAGRLAVGVLTSNQLDQAEHFLDLADEARLAGKLTTASEHGTRFHKLIFGCASNQRLLTMLDMIDDQTERLRRMAARKIGRMEKSAAEHRQILATLRQGDPGEVEATFRVHLQSFLEDLIAQLQQSRVDGDANKMLTYDDAQLYGRNSR